MPSEERMVSALEAVRSRVDQFHSANVSCFGGDDGELVVYPKGGTKPHTIDYIMDDGVKQGSVPKD